LWEPLLGEQDEADAFDVAARARKRQLMANPKGWRDDRVTTSFLYPPPLAST